MTPPPTFLSHALALTILSTTGVLVGLCFGGAVSRARRYRRSGSRREKLRDLGYILVRVGLPIIPGLIAWLILPHLYVTPTWQAWVYVVGLIVPFVGYLILALVGEDPEPDLEPDPEPGRSTE